MKYLAPGRVKPVVVAFLVAMTLIHLAIVMKLVPYLSAGYQDFTIFYAAAKMVRTGQRPALYDLSAQYRMENQFAPKVEVRKGPLPYNHLPFEALLFVPFTFLGYVPAYVAWTVVNLILLGLGLVLLRREFPEIRALPGALLGLAALGFFPVAIALIQGQDSILLLLLTTGALIAMERQRDTAAGIMLGIGLFKFHLVIPLVLILAIRRWRLLAGFIPAALLLAALSVALVGSAGAAEYLRFTFHLEQSGAGGAIVPADMPNLRGLISGLVGEHAAMLALALTLGCSLAVFLAALHRAQRAPEPIAISFGMATVATILVSYHLLPYDLSLLLPVALLLFTHDRRVKDVRTDLILLGLLYLTPLYVLLWLHWQQLCWFSLVLIGLFWTLTFGKAREIGTPIA